MIFHRILPGNSARIPQGIVYILQSLLLASLSFSLQRKNQVKRGGASGKTHLHDFTQDSPRQQPKISRRMFLDPRSTAPKNSPILSECSSCMSEGAVQIACVSFYLQRESDQAWGGHVGSLSLSCLPAYLLAFLLASLLLFVWCPRRD